MRLLEFSFLADENVDRHVVHWLRENGTDVEFVPEGPLVGTSDFELLDRAARRDQVVLTYDSDFGTLAIRDELPSSGIVFVRPGSLASREVTAMLQAADREIPALDPPFILVLDRRSDRSRFRLRRFDKE